ncbi:MAG TPA: trehalose-phosphatase [Rhodothermales bacterium]
MNVPSPPVVERPVFFLDYDGTLAPIVLEAMRAFPHPGLPPVLAALAQHHPTWIVTGRDLGTLGKLLPVNLPAVGLHGVEWGTVGSAKEVRIAEQDRLAILAMRERVPTLPGVWVEDKGALFAVHFRGAEDPDAVAQALTAWVKAAPECLEVVWGKLVVEFRPRGVSKGTVVEELLARYPEREPVCLGDDVTDEDAFRALGTRGVSIKVGAGSTDAPYRLDGVEDVLEYLSRYL